MDHLLQLLRVGSFEILLGAYRAAGVDLGNALDGGAGHGTTAEQMLKHLDSGASVFAYEPFIGNHRFFEGRDPRIKLIKKALSSEQKTMNLSVSAVVQADSAWGKRGLVGYSSAGCLSEGASMNEHDSFVECVRADEDIPNDQRIGFVKLDLQGGELNALKGMSRFLKSDVALMWVEYYYSPNTAPAEIYQYIVENDFLVFDTEYLFRGAPSPEVEKYFEVSQQGAKLSHGSSVWKGFRRFPWENFLEDSERFVSEFALIQTDLCCVNKNYLREFLNALRFVE